MGANRRWHASCLLLDMWKKFVRLFKIKTRLEAWAVIYALSLGAVTRGFDYIEKYPGFSGYALFAACTGAVFMAGAVLLDYTRKSKVQEPKVALPRSRAPSSIRRNKLRLRNRTEARLRRNPQRFGQALHP